MRTLVLSLLFVVAFSATLIANIPAVWVVNAVNPRALGVDYDDVRGTIWNSAMTGVRTNRGAFGRVDLAIQPLALLTGRLSADIRVAGAGINGSGVVDVSLARRLHLRDAQMVMDVSAAEALHDLVRARGGEVFVRIDRLVFDSAGCHEAAGVVITDVLARPDGRTSWRGPELQGAPQCRDTDLVLVMNGADDTGAIRVEASVSPDGGARFFADVETDDPDFQLAAGLFGFDRADGSYRYMRQVQLLDLSG